MFGDALNDNLEIKMAPNGATQSLQVFSKGVSIAIKLNGSGSVVLTDSPVTRIEVSAGAGNDVVKIGQWLGIPALIMGATETTSFGEVLRMTRSLVRMGMMFFAAMVGTIPSMADRTMIRFGGAGSDSYWGGYGTDNVRCHRNDKSIVAAVERGEFNNYLLQGNDGDFDNPIKFILNDKAANWTHADIVQMDGFADPLILKTGNFSLLRTHDGQIYYF